jgi:hypothetical protein
MSRPLAWLSIYLSLYIYIYKNFGKETERKISAKDYKTLTNFIELSPSLKSASCAATQELPTLYGTRRFITVFTRSLHWSLS